MNSVVEALFLLTPYDIDKAKIRVGPPGDGGYILVDDLSADQIVLSFGIGAEYRFDIDLAERGHQVFMFDHTIARIEPPHPKMHYIREGIAGQSNAAEKLYSLRDHLDRHGIKGQRLILKMDVEGAEFEALSAAPDSLLEAIEQLVIEVHSLDRLIEPDYRSAFCEMFRKINRHFTTFHVHANNFDGPDTFGVVDGLPVPRIIELSLVRTTSVVRRPSRTLYPTSLDYPNVAQKDKLLWMFPFLPTTVHPEMFAFCADRINLTERMRLSGMVA
jgi:hypothetical protein